MTSDSYTEKLTLAEIKENHGAMFADLTKDFKHYNFGQKMESCIKFMGMCMDESLKHLGVYVCKINTKSAVALRLHENKTQKALDINKVRVERHKHHVEKDAWMNGMYLYKDDVLVYFISEPMTLTPSQFAKNREKSFCIITNAKGL